jgi:hypothetical protein
MSSAPTRSPKTKAASKTTLPSKAVARAPAVAAKPNKGNSQARPGSAPPLDAQERDRLIAQAAYFRAEKRGFAPGCELQDWIEAEAEVLRLIGRP